MDQRFLEFAGEITQEELVFVDIYVGDHLAILIPKSGVFEYALEPHSLPSYMFAYMYYERAYVCINDNLIPLKPGGLLALSPNIEHYEVPMGMDSRYVCINIKHEYLDQLYFEATGERIKEYQGEYIFLPDDLPNLVRQYIVEYEEKILGYEAICKSIETIMITSILRSLIGKRDKKLSMKVRKEIEVSIQYMYEHIQYRIRLQELAKVANMSVSQYSKTFKNDLGTSPMDYLNTLRLERARKMLISTEQKVTEIADQCGFIDASYLASKFKEKFSISPREFRANYSSK